MYLKSARIMPVAAAILCPVIAAVVLASPLWAQEAGDAAPGEQEAPSDTAGRAPAEGQSAPENPAADSAPEGTAAGETAQGGAAGGPVVVEVEEGSVLDDQTFEGVDDDFIPSEEIPVDQPIPFPTDI